MSYYSDVAVFHSDDDQFNFDLFARRLARAIRAAQQGSNVVVGLNGAWGSGKTSAINLAIGWLMAMESAEKSLNPLEPDEVKEQDAYRAFFREALVAGMTASERVEVFQKLESKNGAPDGETVIIRYNPWLVSGHETLISDFFRIFGERVATHAAPDAAVNIKRYAREIASLTERFSGAVDGGLRLAALGVDVMGGAGAASASLEVAGRVSKQAQTASRRARELIDKQADITLQDVRLKLKAQLRRMDIKFLVIIDDIDRLESSEVKPLLSMVKSVGDLPNVTYLLGFDRALVELALAENQSNNDNSPSFLDKIIQIDIDLPRVSNRLLRRDLCHWLEENLDRKLSQEEFDDLEYDFLSSRQLFENPRDIVRLKNAIISVRIFTGRELQINDVIRMEAIRLKERDLFDWIIENQSSIGPYTVDSGYESFGGVKTEFLEDGLKRASQRRRSACIELLARTLPAFKDLDAASELEAGDGATNNGKSGWRIRSPEGWHAYTLLYPHQDTLTQNEWDYTNSIKGNREKCRTFLLTLSKRDRTDGTSMVVSLLEDLTRFVGEDNGHHPVGLLQALLESDEKHFIPGRRLFGGLPANSLKHLFRLIPQLERTEFLAATVTDKLTKLGLVASLIVEVGRPFNLAWGYSDGNKPEELLPEQSLRQIAQTLVERIKKSSIREISTGHQTAPLFLLVANVSTKGEAKALANKCFAGDEPISVEIIKFLSTFVFSTDGNEWQFRQQPDEALYPLHEMKDYALRRLKSGDAENDRQVLEAFVETVSKNEL